MTLTWHGRRVAEADKTIIWRGFVIAAFVFVHLFVSVKARADETVAPTRPASPVVSWSQASSATLFEPAVWPSQDRVMASIPGFDAPQTVGSELAPQPDAGMYAGFRVFEMKMGRGASKLNMTLAEPFVGGFIRF